MANFKGFPNEFFTFFANLKQNNSKDWFEKNRKDYEQFVMHPAREYVVEMGEKLRKIAPWVHAIPKINKSLFKINRDVRFSNDKSPYKTYMGILLWDGHRKRMECSGFYLHVENKMVMIGVGIKMFSKPLLDRYRLGIVDKKLGAELREFLKRCPTKAIWSTGSITKKSPAVLTPNIQMRNFCYTMD